MYELYKVLANNTTPNREILFQTMTRVTYLLRRGDSEGESSLVWGHQFASNQQHNQSSILIYCLKVDSKCLSHMFWTFIYNASDCFESQPQRLQVHLMVGSLLHETVTFTGLISKRYSAMLAMCLKGSCYEIQKRLIETCLIAQSLCALILN